MYRSGSHFTLHPRFLHVPPSASDKTDMKQDPSSRELIQSGGVAWALQMRAVSTKEPSRLVQHLTGAILGCGGWVLSRGATDTGMVNMLFEFERQACIDIYSILIATGIELSHNGHVRFTELCQCTQHCPQEFYSDIASIDLEIQTFPMERRQELGASRPA